MKGTLRLRDCKSKYIDTFSNNLKKVKESKGNYLKQNGRAERFITNL